MASVTEETTARAVLALASLTAEAPRDHSEAHVMSYLLALDAGTGSIRAVIFDLNGRQLAVGRGRMETPER